jgi:uridine kinase
LSAVPPPGAIRRDAQAGRLPSRSVASEHRPEDHPAAARARIVLLTGPSGSGKSHLAARTGLPTVCLDDFYRDGSERDLPVGPDGRTDWDDARAWDADRALAALTQLAERGRAALPVYDLSQDRTVGSHHLDVGDTRLVIAEGIFAAELIDPCRRAGLLADAVCLTGGPGRTFWRRLARDLREGRKAPWTLVRRGWRLRREEPAIVARHRALGAAVLDSQGAFARLCRLLATTAAASAPDEGAAA